MSAFVIGRGDGAAQISVGDQHKGVSRRHAELSVLDSSTCRLVDLDSANGTEVFDKNAWHRIKRAVVSLDHRVRLGGEFETTVRDLLLIAENQSQRKPAPRNDVPRRPPREGQPFLRLPQKPGTVPPREQAPQRAQPPPLPAAKAVGDSPLPGPGAISATSVCANCSQTFTGNFCAHCGVAAGAGPQGAFTHFVGEFAGPSKLGYVTTLARLLRSPVRTTLELAGDPSYNGHKAFFLASTTIGITVQGYALDNEQTFDANPALKVLFHDNYAMVQWGLTYLSFFVGFLLGYWLFKRFSPAPRSAKEFLKLVCLSSGLSALLGTAMGALQVATKYVPSAMAWAAIILVPYAIYMIYYGLSIQKRFWTLSWPKTVGLMFVQLLLTGIILGVVGGLLGLGAAIYHQAQQNQQVHTPAIEAPAPVPAIPP